MSGQGQQGLGGSSSNDPTQPHVKKPTIRMRTGGLSRRVVTPPRSSARVAKKVKTTKPDVIDLVSSSDSDTTEEDEASPDQNVVTSDNEEDAQGNSQFITTGHGLIMSVSQAAILCFEFENLTLAVIKDLGSAMDSISIADEQQVKAILRNTNATIRCLTQCIEECCKSSTKFRPSWTSFNAKIEEHFASIVAVFMQRDSALGEIIKEKLNAQLSKLMQCEADVCAKIISHSLSSVASSSKGHHHVAVVATTNSPPPFFSSPSTSKKSLTTDAKPRPFKLTGGQVVVRFEYKTDEIYAKNITYDMETPIELTPAERAKISEKYAQANRGKIKANPWRCPVCLSTFCSRKSVQKHMKTGKHTSLGFCRYPECEEYRYNRKHYNAHKTQHWKDDEIHGLFFQESTRSWRPRESADLTFKELRKQRKENEKPGKGKQECKEDDSDSSDSD